MIYACAKHLEAIVDNLLKYYPAVIVLKDFSGSPCTYEPKRHSHAAQYLIIPISESELKDIQQKYTSIYSTTTIAPARLYIA